MVKGGKLREVFAIVGEGPTEFCYLASLRDKLRGQRISIDIKPTTPKHTSVHELAKMIEVLVGSGYSRVYCLIDMDNKVGEELKRYQALKSKYSSGLVVKKSKGISCEVRFFETRPCIELFFLYHFLYTTKAYSNQDALLGQFDAKVSNYKKGELKHSDLLKSGGCLAKAIKHAKQSCASCANGSYSELGELFELLRLSCSCKACKGEASIKE